MANTNISKARWARARSASLEEQAKLLEREKDGGWEARARRRRSADRLRTEAATMRQIAARFDPAGACEVSPYETVTI
ncbi:hypothetical protein CXF96_01590 [Stenotrophomonas sp. Betaine-02u-21]|nr:hypothetical protein CXF96_01590 [Stenotrophomonas sp. Betaine-02u-21]PKH95943.1 hypothetical protein CXG43_09935 [Stenotrophomonas sp. Bg11-02]